MIYSVCLYSTTFLSQFMCTMFLTNWKYTPYYHYITGLNYWETNLLYIWCIVLLFSFRSTKSLVITNLIYFFKLSVFRDWLSPKLLIPNLIVGTVVLHPLAFYLFTVLTFLFLHFKGKALSSLGVPLRSKTLSIFLLSTLLLGSLWALQSNSWGYFWVNDTIEWLLLILILYLLQRIHYWTLTKNEFNGSLLIYSLINLVVLIRLNFLPTRHNFITTKVTIYIVVFCYYFLLECFLKQVVLQKKNNPRIFIFFLVSLLFIYTQFKNGYAVVMLKFSWALMLLYTLVPRVSGFIKNLYSHVILLPLSLVWLSLFSFFEIVYSNITKIQITKWVSFESLLTITDLVFFNTNGYNLLEFAEFTTFENYSNFNFNLYGVTASVILSNYCLVFLLPFIFFIFKTGWI